MMGMFVEDVIAADMLLACVVVLSLLSVVSPLTDQKACFNKVTNTMKYSEWPCILRADASLHTSQIYQVAANICEREIPCTYYFTSVKRVYIPYTSVCEQSSSPSP